MPIQFSIIVPCHNSAGYLDETLGCLIGQSAKNLEIICVDDCSTDETAALLRKWATLDKRIRIASTASDTPRGAGAARNVGLEQARGTYTLFFDSDDLCSPHLLEKAGKLADKYHADVVAFDFERLYADGHRARTGSIFFHPPENRIFFNYQDCPDFIMSAINPTPWNKLYRTAFLRERHLHFDEISSTNDIAFSAVSVAAAERVAICDEGLMTYRAERPQSITSGKTKNLDNVLAAVQSAVAQAEALPYAHEIEKSIRRFEADNYTAALRNYASPLQTDSQIEYYTQIRKRLSSTAFDPLLEGYSAGDDVLDWLQVARALDAAEYQRESQKEIIVSLTSYPARIASVAAVIASLDDQTRKPDRIVLYLAKNQFPQKEGELPSDLLDLVRSGKTEIRWVDDDLGPHKKYFYALQEFDDALVVTIDDDLVYPREMIDNLYTTHLRHPDTIPAVRAHLITYNEKGRCKPYRQWVMEFGGLQQTPAMRLLATGGAGALYPTALFRDYEFDAASLQTYAPRADDLWLKAIEVELGIPVTIACRPAPLQYLPGTQDVGLFHQNLDQGENDTQWAAIETYFAQKHNIDFAQTIYRWADDHAPHERELLLEFFSNALAESRRQTEDAHREIEAIRASHTWKAGRIVLLPLRAARLAFRKISKQHR